MCPITLRDPIAEWMEAVDELAELLGHKNFSSLEVQEHIDARHDVPQLQARMLFAGEPHGR